MGGKDQIRLKNVILVSFSVVFLDTLLFECPDAVNSPALIPAEFHNWEGIDVRPVRGHQLTRVFHIVFENSVDSHGKNTRYLPCPIRFVAQLMSDSSVLFKIKQCALRRRCIEQLPHLYLSYCTVCALLHQMKREGYPLPTRLKQRCSNGFRPSRPHNAIHFGEIWAVAPRLPCI